MVDLKTKERLNYLMDLINTLNDEEVYRQDLDKHMAALRFKDKENGVVETKEMKEGRAGQFTKERLTACHKAIAELAKLQECV